MEDGTHLESLMRSSLDARLDALRRALAEEPDPTRAARRLMAIIADPALRRHGDRAEHARLGQRLWTLLGRIGRRPADGEGPIPMERYAPGGILHGFVPLGLREAPFVYFERERLGLLVAPGRGGASHHRFTLPAEAAPLRTVAPPREADAS